MIVELEKDKLSFDKKSKAYTNHRMLLPEPATYKMPSRDDEERAGQARTFSMDPEKRRCRFPFIIYAALKEPGCGSFVMSTTCNVMVRGGIWWGEPSMKILSRLIHCEILEPTYLVSMRFRDHERFT